MTVHKAQGSEFDRVLLVLGDTDSRVATRDLLYTGATRARRSVVIVATPEILRAAVARRVRRVSGLASALAGMPATGMPATGVPATGVPANGVPANGVPADTVRITPEPDPDAGPEPPNGEGPGQMSLFS